MANHLRRGIFPRFKEDASREDEEAERVNGKETETCAFLFACNSIEYSIVHHVVFYCCNHEGINIGFALVALKPHFVESYVRT